MTLYNQEAEKILLGSFIMNNDLFWKVAGKLKADDFFFPENRKIYNHLSLVISQKKSDSVTLSSFFESQLEDGKKYLTHLLSLATIFNIETYANLISELAQKRKVVDTLSKAIEDCQTKDLSEIQDSIFSSFEQTEKHESDLEHISSILDRVVEKAETKQDDSVKLGYPSLESMIGGFYPNALYIIGARPAMGKSALAVNFAMSAKIDKPVLIFSLEMSKEELGGRILALRSRINAFKVKIGKASDFEIQNLKERAKDFAESVIFVDDNPNTSISTMTNKIKKIEKKHGVGLIIVDYLQLMKTSNKQNRHQEIGEISRGLKRLAKQFKVPVVALAQLSRELEKRENKRPIMSDLKESGDIEQDADVVMFLHREEYYLEREKSSNMSDWMQKMNQAKGMAELLVAKNRSGSVGTVDLRYDANLGIFQEKGGF